MELGLHVANFTWSGGPRALRDTLARTVRDAEAAGIARITVMDHLWQIPGVGRPENEMLEAYTTLGFIAAHTERVLLHTLVSAVVYREPGLLAKQIVTLDALSGGRAGLGIGAAWFEEEAQGLGLPFPPVGERFERLEETLRICLAMWGADEEPFEGAHYTLGRTLSSPRPLRTPRPYLLLGGGGERKTLRYVAQYADACNLFGGPETPHKFDVLRRHCDEVGRDFDDIEKTTTLAVAPGTGRDDLLHQLKERRDLGFTTAYVAGGGEPDALVDLLASVVQDVAED
ncbi:LLM class F420-dependent oxidoreductase [Streptomyces sp. NPDC050560]|uniref:LLM class F420-dependent oxidoreductase n=1 Tax=Streptomyces sp. NPDC050560 TaxID=3365630 RepID=UPI00378E7D90